jgi:hypothetical protein
LGEASSAQNEIATAHDDAPAETLAEAGAAT